MAQIFDKKKYSYEILLQFKLFSIWIYFKMSFIPM